MSDPRHGTVAGYNRIPCRDDCCRLAMANYKKRWTWDRHNGRERIVSALGTRRRVQALNALGWSRGRIAEHSGMSAPNMTRLIYGDTLTRSVAERIARTYEALAMRPPAGPAYAITNVRNRARRAGWPPPLAWDDPDDPNEKPKIGHAVVQYPRAELIEEWDHLRRAGVDLTEAARRLGISRDGLQKAIERAGKRAA